MKKQTITEIQIDDIKFPNIGLGNVGEKRVQVKGALPGQLLKIRAKNGKAPKGEILEVLQPSPHQIPPKCPVFGLCNGCAFQHIPYNYEAELKTNMVRRILAPLQLNAEFLPTIPAANIDGYRNKMEFSFGDDGPDGNLTLGMRKKGSFYEAVDVPDCLLVHPDFGRILAFTRNYFATSGETFHHRRKRTGTLRHLVIRRGILTDEILVNLVTTSGQNYNDYASKLLQIPLDGRLVGILNTINNSPADAVTPEEVRILHGVDYYHEQFTQGLRFNVSAFSFFQTNSIMAEQLYATIANFAGNLTNKTLLDLYCGTGTIGIYLAAHAKQVLGIELIPEAVAAAQKNAALNSVTNCHFIAGDVRKIVQTLDVSPDTIILDPPREGINPKAMPHILAFNAQKIVYVSCKPTSLATDLPAFIAAGYRPTKIRCIDMFPRTANIETVVLLEKSFDTSPPM